MVNAQTLALEKRAQLVKQLAAGLGFDFCGIAKAAYLEAEAPKLETWLTKQFQGDMAWMANYFDKRLDPTLLVDGAQSVIVLGLNYFPAQPIPDQGLKISKYAYGQDYHLVIKDKLRLLLTGINQAIGEVNGRGFVDSAPVLEKAWAVKAGIGWQGKHTNVLNRQQGSFFFLATLIVDLALATDDPIADHCGTCTKCIDACPTQAIVGPNLLNASLCISYLTIELKEQIPQALQPQMDGWIFGCDVCQDVCPWNRFAQPHNTPAFDPNPAIAKAQQDGWTEITEELFEQIAQKSAIKRTKLAGMRRNLAAARHSLKK